MAQNDERSQSWSEKSGNNTVLQLDGSWPTSNECPITDGGEVPIALLKNDSLLIKLQCKGEFGSCISRK